MSTNIAPLDYISDLELQKPKSRFMRSKSFESVTDIIKENKEQSFLADKSMVSFVSEVSGQNRKDILDSTLLAQLAANKKFPDEANLLDWYKAYVEVLSRIGWTVEDSQISTFESKHDVFEIQNVIIDILTTAFGGNFMAVITKTLDSIKKLSDGDGKIIAFEKNTHSLSKGCFQIALAVEKNDTVSVQLGTFLLTSSNEIKRILFFKSSKDKTKLEYSSRRATLNPTVYSNIRESVQKKLGDSSIDFITEIEI